VGTPDRELARLAVRASPEAVAQAREILERDISDAAWAAIVGPTLTEADVATLLRRPQMTIRQDPRLLRIIDGSERSCYPVFQFDGSSVLPGLADVLDVLLGTLAPLSIASWLTTPQAQFGRVSPVVLLRGGTPDAVLAAARRLAN
jgi:hypothetical protein